MALSASSAAKPKLAASARYAHPQIPRELIEALAYEKFEQRGCSHGHDWEDWFMAEKELTVLFRSVRWAVEGGDTPFCLSLRAVGSSHAIRILCRYFQGCPTVVSAVAGQAAQLRLIRPDEPDLTQVGSTMNLDQISNATQEELERLTAARSPVSILSDEDFARLRGRVVALLLDGPDKGKVIATAPLDREHPEKPRRSIREQIAASSYKSRRYQLRQILEGTSTD
jgi:hypothetical protein